MWQAASEIGIWLKIEIGGWITFITGICPPVFK